jgi:type II secretory pathway component PulF
MALYAYQAFSKEGKRVSGSIDAPSLQGAREQLARMGMYPTSITSASQEGGSGLSWFQRLLQRKIDAKDKIFFTKQLNVLLRSGIPLLQALELLVEQTEGAMRTVVIELKDSIREGASLADSLNRYPKTFDSTYVQLVRAGEASGKLELILERLTQYLERQQELEKKVRGALRYPMIQLAIISVVIGVLLTFVVPQISQIFEGEGATLPFSTRLLMNLSYVIRTYYYILIGIAVVAFLAYRWWRSTPRGARIIDTIKLKLPIIGYFVRARAIVQFSKTLAVLIEGGVNLAESLSIVSTIVNNRILVDALLNARENIIKQGKIAQYLEQTKLFPPIAMYLIRTGEESGKLDAMLMTVAQYYEDELADRADALTARLEPLMLIVMATVVGFIVLAIMRPLVEMGLLAE